MGLTFSWVILGFLPYLPLPIPSYNTCLLWVSKHQYLLLLLLFLWLLYLSLSLISCLSAPKSKVMSFIFSSSHPLSSFWMTPSLLLALVIIYILRYLSSVVLTCPQIPDTFPTTFWTPPQEYLLKYSCLILSLSTTYSAESYTKLSSYSLYLTSVKSSHLYYYLLSDPKFGHPINWTSKILSLFPTYSNCHCSIEGHRDPTLL